MATESGFKGFHRRTKDEATPEQMGITEDAASNLHGLKWLAILAVAVLVIFCVWYIGSGRFAEATVRATQTSSP